MKWYETEDPDDLDEEDTEAFGALRKVRETNRPHRHVSQLPIQDLRTFMDSVLVVDQDLVTGAVRTLALNTLSAYQSGVTLKWSDAELAVYLVYIFGEINKCKPYSSISLFSSSHLLVSWRQRPGSILPNTSLADKRATQRDRLL